MYLCCSATCPRSWVPGGAGAGEDVRGEGAQPTDTVRAPSGPFERSTSRSTTGFPRQPIRGRGKTGDIKWRQSLTVKPNTFTLVTHIFIGMKITLTITYPEKFRRFKAAVNVFFFLSKGPRLEREGHEPVTVQAARLGRTARAAAAPG